MYNLPLSEISRLWLMLVLVSALPFNLNELFSERVALNILSLVNSSMAFPKIETPTYSQ